MNSQNNSSQTNTNDSGGMGTFSHVPGGTDYLSPWDIEKHTDALFPSGNPTPILYKFENGTGDWGSPHLLTLKVTPYLGLAYYDGNNDGDYYGHDITGFSNLYASGNEIGNFIPGVTFEMDGTQLPYYGTAVLEIESSSDHCPVMTNVLTTINPNSEFFDVSPVVGGGSAEEKLLKDYGKVFYYYIEAINPVNNTVVWSGFMMPENHLPVADPGYWSSTGVSANISGVGFGIPLWYNVNSLPNRVPSEEVIIDPVILGGPYTSRATFIHNGSDIFIEVKTQLDAMYVIMSPF